MEVSHQPANRVEKYSAFANTHWSLVLRASDQTSGGADAALESLCRTYWQPLYGFVRRRGYAVEDAQDLTQAFFARLLSKQYLAAVDRRKGKFRSFLLASLEHFLANQWRDARAKKRGGDVTFIAYSEELEDGVPTTAVDRETAEKAFEQQWAMTLLNHVLQMLQSEFGAMGKEDLYRDLSGALTGEGESSYAEIAAKHRMSEAAVKMTVYRMRKRFGDLLRAELLNTVADPDEVDDELRALFAALS
jgi:RNA polymerase sigma factor (sigma-70 family)